MKKVLLKQISFYLVFKLAVVGIYLVALSVVSYFHFLLGHGFSIIEDWVADYLWEIVSFSKIGAFFFIVAILGIQSPKRYPFRDFVLDIPRTFSKEIYAVIIFFFFFVIVLSNPISTINHNFRVSMFIATFLGTYIFYMGDIVAFTFISTIYPDDGRYQNAVFLFVAFIHYWFCKKLFLFAENINLILFCNTFIILCLSRWKRLNWFYPSQFCLLYLCPAASFLGINFMWSERYSVLELSTPINPSIYVVLTSIVAGYLYWRNKKIG